MINISLKTKPAAMAVMSTETTDAHQETGTENPAVPANPANTSATIATHEELSIMKCTNKEEAITYKKCLRDLIERAIH